MRELGIATQTEYAERAGISVSYLNDIIHERAACGAGAARKLARASKGKIRIAELILWPERAGDAA